LAENKNPHGDNSPKEGEAPGGSGETGFRQIREAGGAVRAESIFLQRYNFKVEML
jgi:hypothetical protein